MFLNTILMYVCITITPYVHMHMCICMYKCVYIKPPFNVVLKNMQADNKGKCSLCPKVQKF